MQVKDCFLEYKDKCTKLQNIAYKDLLLNNYCLRILGIHFMDHGMNWNSKKHHHSFFELHYVVENNVFTTVNGVKRKIEANQFYIIPPGAFHSHSQENNTSHIGFALRWEFKPQQNDTGYRQKNYYEIDRKINSLSNMSLGNYPLVDNGKIMEMVIDLIKMSENNTSILGMQLAFWQLIIYISDYYSGAEREQVEDQNEFLLEANIINNAIRFMEENYAEQIAVKDIAYSVNLSYSYFAKLFKKHEGETINEYLNKIRLRKAQFLLMCSDKNISNISMETGFCNQNYFSSVFKKQYGMSPKKYRDSKRELSE